MKQKKVDNKWAVEKALIIGELLEMRFGDGTGQSYQVKIATNEMLKLITQTQQDTLQWCLREVVGENEKETDWFNDNIARNVLRKGQRQTIKQRMEEDD